MHVCTGVAYCLLEMLLQRWVGFNPGEGTEEGVGLHSLPCFLKGGHQSRRGSKSDFDFPKIIQLELKLLNIKLQRAPLWHPPPNP